MYPISQSNTPTMCLPWANHWGSNDNPITSIFLNSHEPTLLILPLKCLSQSCHPSGEIGQGTRRRCSVPPQNGHLTHLASCCPSTTTKSHYPARTHQLALSCVKDEIRVLVSQPRLSPFIPFPNPYILVTPTFGPFVSDLFHYTIDWHMVPAPFSTGQALTYPSRPRPNDTSSERPSFTFSGKTHWTAILLIVCLFPQETALHPAREHIQEPCRHRECWMHQWAHFLVHRFQTEVTR